MSFLSDPRPDFVVGDEFHVNGLRFYIQRGRKAAGDLVLYVETPTGPQAVKMSLSCFLADFHNQVENLLYPKAAGNKGGTYFFDALRRAARNGWHHEALIIEAERNLSRLPSTPAQPRLFDWEREGVFD